MKKTVKKITTLACLMTVCFPSVVRECVDTTVTTNRAIALKNRGIAWGCYFNCFKEWNCIPSCVFQSDCYQETCIDCFYGIGDGCKANCQTKGVQAMKEGTVILNKEDYDLSTDYKIENLGGQYYNVTVTYKFTAMREIKDVILGSTVSDGANSTGFYIYMGNRVKKGKTVTKSKTGVARSNTRFVIKK